MIGINIAGYVITKHLGEGGMGSVYLAKHISLNRIAAIKSLHQQFTNNLQLKERFLNEARALGRLEHPNIVKLYHFEENEYGVFLIMEYVEGIELNEFLDNQDEPMTKEEVIELFSMLLDGFQYAHENKIIHRDIKPSNIIINKDKKIKILDFGIAKLIEDDTDLTRTGMMMGSIRYMSPEQVLASSNIDHRSDIYSLGVTLFQMVTGTCPYDSNTTQYEIQNKIVKKPLPDLKEINPKAEISFQKIINKATQKNPEDRYQSCCDFKNSLLEIDMAGNDTVINNGTVIIPGDDDSDPPKKVTSNYTVLILSLIILFLVGFIFIKNFENEVEIIEETQQNPINTNSNNERTLTIDDLNEKQKQVFFKRLSKIYRNESFELEFSQGEKLPTGFSVNVNCEDCIVFDRKDDHSFKGKVDKVGHFLLNISIDDSEGNILTLQDVEFYSNETLPNSTPLKTIKYWLKNIANRKGYKVQTKWDTYENYIRGYGTTYNTEIQSIELIEQNSNYAKVRVHYYSYDSSNNDLDLIQIFHFENFDSRGWKWTAITNESVNIL